MSRDRAQGLLNHVTVFGSHDVIDLRIGVLRDLVMEAPFFRAVSL
jgi:hypothetical protein